MNAEPEPVLEILRGHEGKWVVLSPENTKVIASGDSFEEISFALKDGFAFKMPPLWLILRELHACLAIPLNFQHHHCNIIRLRSACGVILDVLLNPMHDIFRATGETSAHESLQTILTVFS